MLFNQIQTIERRQKPRGATQEIPEDLTRLKSIWLEKLTKQPKPQSELTTRRVQPDGVRWGGETRGRPQPQLIQEVTKDHSRTSKESQTSQPRAALTAKNRIQGRVAKRKPSHLKAFRKMFYEGKSKKTEFRPDDSLVQG